MKHREGFIDGENELAIYWQAWEPATPPVANVVIAHGLGEHGGRYQRVAEQLLDIGCIVHAIDHRGHGKSQGRRALISHFAHAVADLDQLVDQTRTAQPEIPLFLLGHSMGGALSLAYALTHQSKIDGLMLSAPAVALVGASPLLSRLSKLLALIVPVLGVTTIDPATVSRDAAEVAAYRSDPLNFHGRVPVGTIGAMLRFIDTLPTRLPELTPPIRLMHGSDDRLVDISGSEMVFAQVGSADKSFKRYDGLYHEIFNELPAERARVFADLREWITTHVP